MGKQINYKMEYESFLQIAVTALELGCTIFAEHRNHKEFKSDVIQSRDISVVTSDCHNYYFHLMNAGGIAIKTFPDGREYLDRGYNQTGNSIIEAGFSHFNGKQITPARLFVISGYYNDSEEWIARPDCLTKVYNALVRKVKNRSLHRINRQGNIYRR